MYETIVSSLEFWQLIVVAVIAYWLGDKAKRTSLLARNVSIPVGLIVTALLVAEGWKTSEMTLADFIRLDLVTIVVLAVILTGISSVVLKIAEPIVHRAKQSREVMAAKAKRKREEAERARQAAASAVQWEADRPMREAREREYAARKQQEERQKQLIEKRKLEDDKRRESARQRLLLSYHKHCPKIEEAINWERLQEYMSLYMNDKKPADQVESSASRMIDAIKSHFAPPVKKQVRKTIVQVVTEFELQRKQLEGLGLPLEDLEARLAELELQQAMEMEHCK